MCVQEFCPERTGKELNKYTSKKEGNIYARNNFF